MWDGHSRTHAHSSPQLLTATNILEVHRCGRPNHHITKSTESLSHLAWPSLWEYYVLEALRQDCRILTNVLKQELQRHSTMFNNRVPRLSSIINITTTFYHYQLLINTTFYRVTSQGRIKAHKKFSMQTQPGLASGPLALSLHKNRCVLNLLLWPKAVEYIFVWRGSEWH